MGRKGHNYNGLFYYAYYFYGLFEAYQSLGIIVKLRKLSYRLLELGKVLVKNLFLGVSICLKGQLMALGAANIYILDLRWKVESVFGLCNNSLFNGLLLNIFSITILLGLNPDRKPWAVAKQADKDWLQDHFVGIKFAEDGLSIL